LLSANINYQSAFVKARGVGRAIRTAKVLRGRKGVLPRDHPSLTSLPSRTSKAKGKSLGKEKKGANERFARRPAKGLEIVEIPEKGSEGLRIGWYVKKKGLSSAV